VLTYCDPSFVTKLQQEGVEHVHIVAGHVDHEFLEKQLDRPAANGDFPLLVATDGQLTMRGLNYRAKRNGILLLVQAPFAHQRAADQAAYRVGRNNDPGQRQILAQVPLVDPDQEQRYKASLQEFLKQELPKKPRNARAYQKQQQQ